VAQESDPDLVELVLMSLDTISFVRPHDDANRSAFEGILAELRFNHQSQFMSSGADLSGVPSSAPEGSREVVDLDLPVGLANLRNTCYLNSILQYFYSVNAVRNLAVNSDLPALEPTETNLSHVLRASGSGNGSVSDNLSQSRSDIETGRAFVGHECKSLVGWRCRFGKFDADM
jgi:ubiquitin carboxyl-terminal hydrolase 25/28